MQEELITLQFGSFSNQQLEKWWNLEKLNTLVNYEIEPDGNFSSIFSNGNVNKPRTLIFELKDNLERYNFFKVREGPIKKETKLSMWEPSKIDIYNQMSTTKNEESKGEELARPLAYSEFELSNKNFVRLPPPDNYFNIYVTGQNLAEKADLLEETEDKIRHFLEESDHFGGTQVFLDVNSGFGPLAKTTLEYLNDEEGKKPSVLFAIENEFYITNEDTKMLNEMRYINKMINFYMLSDCVSLYHPIDLAQFSKFKNFNPDYIKKNPNSVIDLLPLLISNVTFPYRNTNFKTDNNFKNYTNTLLPYHRTKLINSCFHIRGFPQDLSGAHTETPEKIDSIFAYKFYQPLTMFPLIEDADLNVPNTFGEDFTLRGSLSGIKLPKPRENNFDFHLAELGIQVPYEFTQLLDENILVKYGTLQEDSQKLLIENLPVHSATFNNEIFKYYFKEASDTYTTLGFNSKLQFKKDGTLKDEDLKEMENFYKDMFDLYDKEIDDA